MPTWPDRGETEARHSAVRPQQLPSATGEPAHGVLAQLAVSSAVFDALPVATLIYDTNGVITRANNAARALLGLDHHSVHDPFRVTRPHSGQATRRVSSDTTDRPLSAEKAYILRLVQGDTVSSDNPVETTLTTPDGREIIVRFSGNPLYDEHHRITGAIVVAQDVTERRHTEHELIAMQALTDSAISHLTLDDLLPALLQRLRSVMQVDNAAILLLDASGRNLRIRAVCGAEEAVAPNVRVPMGQGFAGRIAAERKPLVIDDLSTYPVANRFLAENLRTAVGVPLLLGDRVLGVVHIGSATPRKFTDGDVRLLQRAADRVAVAIDRAEAFEVAETRRRQMEGMFEAMADGVILYDVEGKILDRNAAARDLFAHCTPAEYSTLSLVDRARLMCFRDTHGQPLPLGKMPPYRLLSGEVLTGANAPDILLPLGENEPLLVNVTGAPIRNADNAITGAVAIFHDVTDRRRLERRTQDALDALLQMAAILVQPQEEQEQLANEALNTQNALPLNFASAAPSSRILASLAQRVLGCNRVGLHAIDHASERLYPLAIAGLAPDEERHWRHILRDGLDLGADHILAGILRRLRTGEVVMADLSRKPFSDWPNPFNVRFALYAPMQVGNELTGIMTFDFSRTDRELDEGVMRLAAALAHVAAFVVDRERLIRERAAAESQALALREATRRMDEFLSIASHELRTPVTIIKANVQMLMRQRASRSANAESDIEARLRERVERAIDRLLRLVDDLLDASRARVGRLEFHRMPADLVALARETVDEQVLSHPDRRIRLHVDADGSVPVVVDAERVSQVMVNYLTNALKYSLQQKPVTVRVSRDTTQARVEVRDEGPGIPAGERDRVWELFYRVQGVDVLSGSGVGLGLGLHLCKTIIERHTGTVGVESVPGEGSTFWFTLPLADAPESA